MIPPGFLLPRGPGCQTSIQWCEGFPRKERFETSVALVNHAVCFSGAGLSEFRRITVLLMPDNIGSFGQQSRRDYHEDNEVVFYRLVPQRNQGSEGRPSPSLLNLRGSFDSLAVEVILFVPL